MQNITEKSSLLNSKYFIRHHYELDEIKKDKLPTDRYNYTVCHLKYVYMSENRSQSHTRYFI